MAKFNIGDKVVVVDADSVYDTYKNGDTGVVIAYDNCPDSAGYVRREDGELMNVYWSEVELIEGEKDSKGAESLRKSILDIRSKREALQKEILRLDEQEKGAVEKLKEQGFVLYEDNVSKELDVKELAATENKAVLYAEDIEEDMTDPKSWRVGDKFTVLDVNDVGLGAPEDLSLMDVRCLTAYGQHGDIPMYALGDCLHSAWVTCDQIKFHSRPVK